MPDDDRARFFLLAGPESREVPGDWLRQRLQLSDPHLDRNARLLAIEIAPGVRVASLGWGDHLVPSDNPEGWRVLAGAMVAVFTDEAAAIKLLEEALFLRMNGERPPGAPRDNPAAETWADWDRRAEGFLRARMGTD